MSTLRVPSPSAWASAIGFSAAVRADNWILVAGTTAVDQHGNLVGGTSAYAQAREALRKIGSALDRVGGSLGDVVQTRIYLTDVASAEAVGRAHREVFADTPPAATMIAVAALLDPRMMVEIEATAWLGT